MVRIRAGNHPASLEVESVLDLAILQVAHPGPALNGRDIVRQVQAILNNNHRFWLEHEKRWRLGWEVSVGLTIMDRPDPEFSADVVFWVARCGEDAFLLEEGGSFHPSFFAYNIEGAIAGLFYMVRNYYAANICLPVNLNVGTWTQSVARRFGKQNLMQSLRKLELMSRSDLYAYISEITRSGGEWLKEVPGVISDCMRELHSA